MLRVNNDFFIKTYSQGYKVYKDLHKKDSKEHDVYDFLGYARDIPYALRMIQRQMEKDKVEKMDMNLKEAIEEFKKIHDDLFEDYLNIEKTINNNDISQS